MSIRAALITGTTASLAVTAVWSWTATLSIGPAAPLHLTRDLPGDYTQLAATATGSSPWALFAVTAAIYTACLLVSGLCARRRARRHASRDFEYAEETGAAS